jgi:hypothetical protein
MPRGLSDGPSTTWCRVGFSMLKSPRAGRPDASRSFHGALDDRFGASPIALIGPRCACLRPPRASLSLDKLPPYHTMRLYSLDPRAEPMSRHHDRCAPHNRRAERRDPMERFRKIRVSSVSYRAKGPVHSKLQQYNYEIHPGARDHSHTCATTKYMHRRLARQTRTRKARQKQSGRDRARPLRAHAPDPGADRTRVPRCPRRCARCSWTPRCARALTCDRAASRSASSRRARVEWVCKGGRILPALRCRRRGSRRHKLAGGHVTPCSRVDHAWGTSRRDRRAHSEQGCQRQRPDGTGKREGSSARRRAPGRPTATGGRSAPAVRWRVPASRVLVDEIAVVLQEFGVLLHPSIRLLICAHSPASSATIKMSVPGARHAGFERMVSRLEASNMGSAEAPFA